MNPNQTLIDSGWKFVACVSGGGQEVFGELTRYGDMSGTLLEGIVPYSVPAFHNLVGGPLDHIVSPAAARAAAMACYWRAISYSNTPKVFGFASTGAVVRVGGEREGRRHRVCMAIQDKERTIGMDFELEPGRTRLEEERLVAACIRVALTWGCHRFADMRPELMPDDKFEMVTHNASIEEQLLIHGNSNSIYVGRTSNVIFSSSCNPLHEGHLAIIQDASRLLNSPVDIELCVMNPDKPPLDYLTLNERLRKTRETVVGNPHVGCIIPTSEPYFFDKAKVFPGATFVVGADTYDRIFDFSYYDGVNQLSDGVCDFEKYGCRFLVYPRQGYLIKNLPPAISPQKRITTFVTSFEASGLSSTAIRRKEIDSHGPA